MKKDLRLVSPEDLPYDTDPYQGSCSSYEAWVENMIHEWGESGECPLCHSAKRYEEPLAAWVRMGAWFLLITGAWCVFILLGLLILAFL